MEITNLLRLSEVIHRTGLGRSTLYALAKNGECPKPIKIGPRRAAWILEEIQEWVSDRIKESRGNRVA
mgnify:CR=1 FL=1